MKQADRHLPVGWWQAPASAMLGLVMLMLGLIMLLGIPKAVSAFSIGDIQIHSTLGETFRAEIPLEMRWDERAKRVEVHIADPGTYQSMGLPHHWVVTGLDIRLEGKGQSRRILLTSASPIHTPLFNLLLKTSVGMGTHYRQYPVLLAMPTVHGVTEPTFLSPPPPSHRTVAPQPAKATQQEHAPGMPPNHQPDIPAGIQPDVLPKIPPTMQPSLSQDIPPKPQPNRRRYGPVRSGERVASIARKIQPTAGISLNQVMVALWQANPKRFVHGNMHALSVGGMLDIPTQEEMAKVSNEEAVEAINQQQQAWKESVRITAERKKEYNLRLTVAEERSSPHHATGEMASKAPLSDILAETMQRLAHSEAERARLRTQLTSLQKRLERLEKKSARPLPTLTPDHTARSPEKSPRVSPPLSTEQPHHAAVSLTQTWHPWAWYGGSGLAGFLLAAFLAWWHRKRDNRTISPFAEEKHPTQRTLVGLEPFIDETVPVIPVAETPMPHTPNASNPIVPDGLDGHTVKEAPKSVEDPFSMTETAQEIFPTAGSPNHETESAEDPFSAQKATQETFETIELQDHKTESLNETFSRLATPEEPLEPTESLEVITFIEADDTHHSNGQKIPLSASQTENTHTPETIEERTRLPSDDHDESLEVFELDDTFNIHQEPDTPASISVNDGTSDSHTSLSQTREADTPHASSPTLILDEEER